MSCLKLCDAEDCYQTENDDVVMYHIDYETQEFLKQHCSSCFNGYDDICSDCVEQINEDYEDFFIVDGHRDLSINKKYIDNPQLLK